MEIRQDMLTGLGKPLVEVPERDIKSASKAELIEIIGFLRMMNEKAWEVADQRKEASRDTYRECAQRLREIASSIDTTKVVGRDIVQWMLNEAKEWEA
jgi:hypothetical protein